MASGIRSNGADLDDLLLPIGAFTPIANVNIQVSGVDIANRYAGAAHGTPYGTLNIQSGGVDIGTLFAAKNTNSMLAGTGIFTLSGQAATLTGPSATTITLNAAQLLAFGGDFTYGFSINDTPSGSVSPTTFKGYSIQQLYSAVDTIASTYGDTFSISAISDPGSNLWNTMTVGSKSRTSASSQYSFSNGVARWFWSGGAPYTQALFLSATTYSVVFT